MDEYDKANDGKNEKCATSKELRQVVQDPPRLTNHTE